MEELYYWMEIPCGNCTVREKVRIPKGWTVDLWKAKNPTCPNCGCKRIKEGYYGGA